MSANTFVSSANAWKAKAIDNRRYLRNVVGKNLFDFEDLLHGYAYTPSGGYREYADGIMSNRLYLSPGIYTLQGVGGDASHTVQILGFNDRDEMLFADPISLDDNGIGHYTVDCSGHFFHVVYWRICLQVDAVTTFDHSIAQLEKGNVATAIEAPVVALEQNPNCGKREKLIFISGASTTIPANGWFERACRELGFASRNVAVSGDSVMQHASKAWRGALWTPAELDAMDVLMLSHTHNYNVAFQPENPTLLKATVEEYEQCAFDDSNNPLPEGSADPQDMTQRLLPYGSKGAGGTIEDVPEIDERYAAGFDYLIKKYRQECYRLKDNPHSAWFGSEYGKPCTIIICSHWHDGYETYHSAAKELCNRTGAIFLDTASFTGFTYKTTDPSNPQSIRWSGEVCHNAKHNSGNDRTKVAIAGVWYDEMGFHPTRDINSAFNIRRAAIVKDLLRKLLL